MLKKIGLAVAVAAASASANAAWEATGENSELVLNIWNSTAGEEASLSLDLGYLTSNGPLGNETLSFSVDTAAIANIAGTASLDSLQWNVGGVDSRIIDAAEDVAPYGLYITAVDAPNLGSQYNLNSTKSVAEGAFNNLDAYLQGNLNDNTSIVGGTADDALYQTTGAGSYAGNDDVFGSSAFGLGKTAWFTPFTAAASGESLYAYKLGAKVGSAGLTTDFATSAGVWTFDATSGSLTYGAAVAAVPVPAAVWMFASGLLGLAGVARRKKA